MTVMGLLLATDDQAINGLLYNGNATRRNEANAVYSALNQAGSVSEPQGASAKRARTREGGVGPMSSVLDRRGPMPPKGGQYHGRAGRAARATNKSGGGGGELAAAAAPGRRPVRPLRLWNAHSAAGAPTYWAGAGGVPAGKSLQPPPRGDNLNRRDRPGAPRGTRPGGPAQGRTAHEASH
jgi:hypothetical protein